MCGLIHLHLCWANVTSFLGPNTAGARGKTCLDSKGVRLWLRPVLQIIGEILIPISSSPLTSKGRELHLVWVFFDTQECTSDTGKSLIQL